LMTVNVRLYQSKKVNSFKCTQGKELLCVYLAAQGIIEFYTENILNIIRKP